MIEMLVSLAIFGIITAFVTANFRAGRQSDELRIGSQLLATSIRRAQTMALAGQQTFMCSGGTRDKLTCPSGQDADCGGGLCIRTVPNGYGVHLTTASGASAKVIVFADGNGNRAYDPGEEVRTDLISPGVFVVVQSLDPVSGGALDIVFDPPKPTVWYNGSNAQPIATVVIQHTISTKTKTVTVNAISGQVSSD